MSSVISVVDRKVGVPPPQCNCVTGDTASANAATIPISFAR